MTDKGGKFPIFNCLINIISLSLITSLTVAAQEAATKSEFDAAYKNYMGEDFKMEDKYVDYSISKSTINVGKYDDLYSQIITYTTFSVISAWNPALGAFLDISMLLSPEDPIPVGTYTQYTINLYEAPVTIKEPISEHGYIIGYQEKTYQNHKSLTYIVGPGNAGYMVQTDSSYYQGYLMSYYKNNPWARR